MGAVPDYTAVNRSNWDRWAAEYVEAGRANWAGEPRWGIFGVPDTDVGLLPGDLDGKDAVELGCGTGYVSAWLARRGARPVGVDNSTAQLTTARRLQQEFGLRFPLVHGIAERLPFPGESFDVAISEYGAVIWADPYRWVPEAARVLRPGGELVTFGNASLLMLFVEDDAEAAAGTTLLRPYFGMHRFDWEDDGAVEFHVGYGDWIRLFGRCGLVVEDLIEVRPPEGATTRYPFVTGEWARRWPAEQAWKVRKAG